MLSDVDIKFALAEGNIVIEPFNESQLGTNSYDARLGEWYYEQQDVVHFNPYDADSVKAFWGEPKQSKKYICIKPGETILAHTQEIVGGRNGYLASMRTRSSIARSCLDVCGSAGLGDVGFINIWTMEISNKSKSYITLEVGERICQFEFHRVGQTLKEYKGSYGQGLWRPEDLLPKLKRDSEYKGFK